MISCLHVPLSLYPKNVHDFLYRLNLRNREIVFVGKVVSDESRRETFMSKLVEEYLGKIPVLI